MAKFEFTFGGNIIEILTLVIALISLTVSIILIIQTHGVLKGQQTQIFQLKLQTKLQQGLSNMRQNSTK